MAQAILSNETVQGASRTRLDGINTGAISWAAIIGGAVAATALSLILLLLGMGLGLSSISPWARHGVEAATFGVSAIVWITVTQILASGMGGYLTGRLRVKWTDMQPDEVYFRDTAHGFLAWAVATLAMAALLTSTIGAVVHGGAQAGASLAGGIAKTGAVAAAGAEMAKSGNTQKARGEMGYFVDALFRHNADSTAASAEAGRQVPAAEVTRIFAHAGAAETLPANDATYLAQLVARHTGLSQAEAEQRVSEVYANLQFAAKEAKAKAKEAADQARKASIYITLWLFVSLLIGAFSASLAATCGGRCRDA